MTSHRRPDQHRSSRPLGGPGATPLGAVLSFLLLLLLLIGVTPGAPAAAQDNPGESRSGRIERGPRRPPGPPDGRGRGQHGRARGDDGSQSGDDAVDPRRGRREDRRAVRDRLRARGTGMRATPEGAGAVRAARARSGGQGGVVLNRADRRRAEVWARLRRRGNLSRPAELAAPVRAELRIHARRRARLDRIDQLAKSAEDDEARARVAELRRREEARHERRLAALMGGPGGSPRNDQP